MNILISVSCIDSTAKNIFVSYFKSKHDVVQTWLEECIYGPSVGLKQTVHVSFPNVFAVF